MKYRTRDGDILDEIVFEYYGTSTPLVDVLKANLGLAELGPVYPAGIEIELPEITKKAAEKPLLWS